jgi:hypothetical protein
METAVDYISAVQKGLDKYKIEEDRLIKDNKIEKENMIEIEGVFKSLTASIQNNKQFKGLKIEIYCGDQPAIWVKNSLEHRKRIANCFLGRFGYPCKITFDSREIWCESKHQLEECLLVLLSSTTTGGIINSLLGNTI